MGWIISVAAGADEKSLTTLVNDLLLLPQCTSRSALTKSSLWFLLQERDLCALLYENKLCFGRKEQRPGIGKFEGASAPIACAVVFCA